MLIKGYIRYYFSFFRTLAIIDVECMLFDPCAQIVVDRPQTFQPVELSIALPPTPAPPPVFTVPLRDLTVQEGSRVTLEVSLGGSGGGAQRPTFTFYHEGRELRDGGGVEVTQQPGGGVRLVLKEVGEGDGGRYTCTARSEGGQTSCSAFLTIQRKGRGGEILALNLPFF